MRNPFCVWLLVGLKWHLGKKILNVFITGNQRKSQNMVSKEEKRREYREEKLRPPGWDPERENYNYWRFVGEYHEYHEGIS